LTRTALLETLREGQRLGFFGGGAIELAAEHALGFVAAIGEHAEGARLIDLGSGGGLPGLVLADAYPTLEIVLVDRRQKRTDFLARASSRLGYDHVEVRCADIVDVADAVSAGDEPPFDIATARGFGPPADTLTLARSLIAAQGMIVISDPPGKDRWPPALLADLALQAARVGAVTRFRPVPE
jgi:16S rRNA (guanine527-N7)-methyltransferase